MADGNKNYTKNAIEKAQGDEASDAKVSRGRRSIVKGAAGVLPMVLTLQSGAALARSSNLISATRPHSAKDSHGRTLCLDERSVTLADDGRLGELYDLGDPIDGRVSVIPDRRHFRYDRSAGRVEVSEAEMCESGGTYYYRRRWRNKRVHVDRGLLVSATALSSFAGKIDFDQV